MITITAFIKVTRQEKLKHCVSSTDKNLLYCTASSLIIHYVSANSYATRAKCLLQNLQLLQPPPPLFFIKWVKGHKCLIVGGLTADFEWSSGWTCALLLQFEVHGSVEDSRVQGLGRSFFGPDLVDTKRCMPGTLAILEMFWPGHLAFTIWPLSLSA